MPDAQSVNTPVTLIIDVNDECVRIGGMRKIFLLKEKDI